MSGFDWLRSRWQKVDSDFRRQATANAVGTCSEARYSRSSSSPGRQGSSTTTLLIVTGIAAAVWILTNELDARGYVTAAILLVLLGLSICQSGIVFVLGLFGVVARLSQLTP
jgi:hypothetical protein